MLQIFGNLSTDKLWSKWGPLFLKICCTEVRLKIPYLQLPYCNVKSSSFVQTPADCVQLLVL